MMDSWGRDWAGKVERGDSPPESWIPGRSQSHILQIFLILASVVPNSAEVSDYVHIANKGIISNIHVSPGIEKSALLSSPDTE
jgi:hypothetical protein